MGRQILFIATEPSEITPARELFKFILRVKLLLKENAFRF